MTITTISFTEFDDAIWRVNIKICDDNEFEIGSGTGILIPWYDLEDHSSAVELADRVSQDAYEVCCGFDPSCLSEYSCITKMLILERIELEKKYRGNGYGLDAMKDVISFFAQITGTVIVMQPHPIGKSDKHPGVKKLRNHWKKCGFKQCKRTPYFFRECDIV
jgi:hypothetical protein